MRPTRRLLGVGLLAVFLTAFAIVVSQPAFLLGTVLIGTWILVRQYHFLSVVSETADSLTVVQLPAVLATQIDSEIPFTITARAENPVSVDVTIDPGVPHAGRLEEPLSLSLETGDSGDERTVMISWPIAGEHSFDRPTLVATDGLFEQSFSQGTAPTVTVEPRDLPDIHVGTGGEPLTSRPGEHRGGMIGSALEPAKVREYVPGDTAKQIDWKATARLATLYVREFEGETDQPTILVMDARSSLLDGPPAETKLDYLRNVSLELTETAREQGDPLGMFTATDAGVVRRVEPAPASVTYTRVRRQLFELRSGPRAQSAVPLTRPNTDSRPPQTFSTRSRVALESTSDADTAFVESLRPFFDTRSHDLDGVDAGSFAGGIQTALRREDRRSLVVLCTDDSNLHDLWDVVRDIREQGHLLLLLLTPSVLFESGELADLESAYQQYIEFEDCRRDLDSVEGVQAFEVAPGSRLSTVLATGRTRRRGERA